MDLLGTKVLVLCLLAAISVFIGLVPLIFSRFIRFGSKASEMVMSCILCAGGGVLLCLCFTHMIPELRESLEANVADGDLREMKVPICELSVCMGFFFIYLIEEVVHLIFGSHSHVPGNESEHKHDSQHKRDSVDSAMRGVSELKLTEDAKSAKESNIDVVNAVRAFLMVLALSFHAIMEGIMVGLQEHSHDVWVLFAAIGLHKFAIMFCLSVELLAAQSRIWVHVLYVFVYGTISSIGMAIGIGIYQNMENNNTDSAPINILQCIAAGTLIYVAFFEVLYREKMKPGNGLLKFVCIIIGFGVLLTIDSCIVDEHDHSHGGESEHEHEHEHAH